MKRSITFLFIVMMFMKVSAQNSEMRININPGESYLHSVFFSKFGPQIAIWVETKTGKMVTDIYVTPYTGVAMKNGKIKRPSALPVYCSRKNGVPEKLEADYDGETSATSKIDGVTAPTPKERSQKTWWVPNSYKGTTLVVFVEINNSFDYNNTYSKKLSKDDKNYSVPNGQPSLIYSVACEIGTQLIKKEIPLVGHGHPRGSDGEIYPVGANITTARNIVKSIELEFHPGD